MSILDAIVERKREEVLRMKDEGEKYEVRKDRCRSRGLDLGSLRRSDDASIVIAEIKPKSPSKGHLLSREDVPKMVEAYNKYASAISVLCDEESFGGGYDLLEEVRGLTSLPILAKEFIVDEVQIRKARSCGADMVLLIAAALTKKEIDHLASVAVELGMTVLFEMHSEEEMEKIPAINSDHLILGINNRNLGDLSIDLAVTERMSSEFRIQYSEFRVISESGIERAEDIERLQDNVDGFLIGTSILQSQDPEKKLEELFTPLASARGDTSLVKICGVKAVEDVMSCEKADLVGLNFVPSSPRYIDLQTAQTLCESLPHTQRVGVFQDLDAEGVNKIATELDLAYVQLHGEESIEYVQSIDYPCIKAFRTVPDANLLREYLLVCDYVLLDGRANGQQADWGAVARLPRDILKRTILAGGLTPENVGEAIETVCPAGVDTASGVEIDGGKDGGKDGGLIADFISSVHS